MLAQLVYCRPGFEGECAQELDALAADAGVPGYARAERGAGYAQFVLAEPAPFASSDDTFAWRRQVFARQSLAVIARLDALPRSDRLTPLLAALPDGFAVADAWVEPPETDEGKTLAAFCRSFGNALVQGLKKSGRMDKTSPLRLHAFFPTGEDCLVALADVRKSAPWPQGIPRLKFPKDAPSRSTLKLDEAFAVLLDERERERWLKPGMSAVDLGAAPGGWTWQLVHRGVHVTAIDNGPMDEALMSSGLVAHLREDGFRYAPKRTVDWMVCDMVEQPRRVAERMAQWLAEGFCRRTIFNLKLPMKKRYAEVQAAFDAMRRIAGDLDIRAKQLYHDREEITVFAQPR
ncbi:23S rRNA (cytidine(2498)-2'-O)-methyltransferase RlmM [Tahibacter soli]|jgi:23S rRNA (cytidine2498-2'-O)-methyltransferase|uniref:Ribosomal RNA large subunit methyltransferase M n=1 Tax=Tahibacter soli TaxID=2983605 RepID=A0A9X3YI65_9GAMM|nr:23S rRNA (cytidine(2498)-2'-O)-methyltransferase RlmM [Tahibacter soli]MDC8011268.1 23S rRNA (cytidine(2498)-2'-O)-methyltransferase RlmM [Tahibacter soli]